MVPISSCWLRENLRAAAVLSLAAGIGTRPMLA
jgi:hypothetical protein